MKRENLQNAVNLDATIKELEIILSRIDDEHRSAYTIAHFQTEPKEDEEEGEMLFIFSGRLNLFDPFLSQKLIRPLMPLLRGSIVSEIERLKSEFEKL